MMMDDNYTNDRHEQENMLLLFSAMLLIKQKLTPSQPAIIPRTECCAVLV
jgi:hypothetical protein